MRALPSFLSLMLLGGTLIAQNTNQSKFKQLYEELPTPNMYRTGGGAPGSFYYQQQADYSMDIRLDDATQRIYGEEVITYTNNSPDPLEYLWIQLDQNMRAPNSMTQKIRNGGVSDKMSYGDLKYLFYDFDGGFKIEYVKDENDQAVPFYINNTMMRINLDKPLANGEQKVLKIKWWYNINDRNKIGGRSGYEYFKDEDNYLYTIAQFFPRMAVYNDVEGWQNKQFLGRGEFALPFGNYDVKITVPADHIVGSTGKLQNADEVLSEEQRDRWEKAQNSTTDPVFIVTESEAKKNEKSKSKQEKTWHFQAGNVRDFAFASSRKFIWDAMAVKLGNRTVMAVSYYPKEGNPLWERYSTRVVAHTLKVYSKYTFDYPYHKAISVHTDRIGMEYPMICFNGGRPEKDGTYSKRTKYGMISVIIHEVGHNFFPMIVNSDERQWTWMDEGLNTFVQCLTEVEWEKDYPSRRGPASLITDYMKAESDQQMPIMTNSESILQFGNNAYGKPATALNILRETVMGRELFDHAFHTYAQRWMFKHPTPEDFFRTMEDASAVDLDWFWRGWFYTTDYTDIGVEDVKKYYVTDKQTEKGRELLERYGANPDEVDAIYVVEEGDKEFEKSMKGKSILENSKKLNEYVMDNFSSEERNNLKVPKYFYQVTFNKPGGLVMPLIVEFTYDDGSTEMKKYPVQVWMKNDNTVTKTIASNKEITKVVVDPDLETADVDLSNNSWPKEETPNEFEQFKNNTDG